MDTIAIFDLDGTLTRRDTLLPWLVQMQSRGSLVWHLPYYLYQYAAYRLRGGADDRYKERIIGTVVRGWSYEEGLQRGAAFADQIDQMWRSRRGLGVVALTWCWPRSWSWQKASIRDALPRPTVRVPKRCAGWT